MIEKFMIENFISQKLEFLKFISNSRIQRPVYLFSLSAYSQLATYFVGKFYLTNKFSHQHLTHFKGEARQNHKVPQIQQAISQRHRCEGREHV